MSDSDTPLCRYGRVGSIRLWPCVQGQNREDNSKNEEGGADLVVTNESDTTAVGFAVWKFPSAVTPGEILDEGIFQAIGTEDEFYEGAWPPTEIGSPYEITVTFDVPGPHGINCFDQSGGDHNGEGLDHVTMFTVAG